MSRWQTLPLREVGTWYGGATPSKSRAEFWENGDVPWLSPKDMRADVLHKTKDHVTCRAIEESSVRLVPADSIAIVVRSGILARTLPVARVSFETTLNQDMKAVVAHDGIDPRWIVYGIRAFEQELLATTRKSGTTVASIETSKMLAFELPVPSRDEQSRIVEILEDHLSRLDVGAALLEKAQARIERMRASAMDSMVWSGSHDEVAIAGLLREKMRNGHSARAVEGSREGIRTLTLTAVTLGVFADEHSKITAADARKVQDLWLRRGDILVQRSNTPELVGTSAIYRGPENWAIFPDLLIRLRIDESRARPEYVALALATERTHRALREQAKGLSGSMPKIDQGAIASTTIPLPPLEEQDRIIGEGNAIREGADRISQSVEIARVRARRLRRALLSAAFSGRLTGAPSDLDRIEELAEVDD